MLSVALLAACSDSDSHRPAATPTATPTRVTVTLNGSCSLPGDGAQGLGPCPAGTSITVYHCDDRSGCLHGDGRTALGVTAVTAGGTWSLLIPAETLPPLIAEAAVADGVTYRALDLALAPLAAQVAGTPATGLTVSPISEASAALLDEYGFENYSDDGAQQVIAAVDAATAGLSFADTTPASAPELAETTALADPTVVATLASAANTPTPTPTPADCCACGGGCFQDTGAGCGDCTAVAGAACVASGCVAYTATITATASRTPTASATATPTGTAPPACCDCGGGCFQDSGDGCGDCTAVADATCVDGGCAGFSPTPSSSPTPSATATLTATVALTATPTHTPVPTATATPTGTATPTISATPTFTATGTVTATVTVTPSPTVAAVCVPDTCQATTDCDCQSRTSLFAIAHSYTDPTDTVLYRVSVASWSTGTAWGDGTNGFFYQATVGGAAPETLAYVPFNGMAVDSDGDPALPAFHFIVPANVSAGTGATSITITACASNQAGTLETDDCGEEQYVPTCTTALWSETYSTLTTPSVGPAPSALVDGSLDFDGTSVVTVQNTGVYPGALTLAPPDGLSASDQAWLYNHLVFFDDDGNPYTNDIFDDCSHPSVGVLTIDEAAYALPGQSTYGTKYGTTATLTAVTAPDRQFFFYSWDQQQTAAIDVGAQFIFDYSADCPGWINGGPGSIAGTCQLDELSGGPAGDLPAIAPYAQVIPANTAGTFSTATSAQAGTQENRTVAISGEVGVSLCEYALNPLAVNDDDAYNPPDYVIDDGAGDWGSFPQGLSYIVPSGFGTCGSAAPFCESASGYTAYIPHYADTDGDFGTLNGGSTAEPLIGSFALADEYAIGDIAAATANTILWFDNCGYGHTYEESSGTEPSLGTRKALPSPPNSGSTYQYDVTNQLAYPIVLGKECCASWYQENTDVSPTAWEPPVQLDDTYGTFIGAGQTLTYETLFSDEVLVVYDAGTGALLFKLRLHPSDGAVYACSADDWSVGIAGSNPYTVAIGGAASQSLACGSVGLCPFGTTAAQDGVSITCTATGSSFLLGIPEWAAAIAADTGAIQLRAWGAEGDDEGGDAGFAMTVMAPADLDANLYGYVGSAYGVSSLIIGQPLSLITAAVAGNTTDPATVGALVIAGGGGTSGDGDNGGAGGNGGVAIANQDPTGGAVSVGGGNGGAGGAGSGNGGNSSGTGDGGSSEGTGGIGGFASGTMWSDDGSLIPPQSWNAGYGPGGNSDCDNIGGKGGGGFGGGGHGGANCGGAGGGGGGGSWAAANTTYDVTAPGSAPDSPNGSAGAVQIAFTLTADCTVSGSSVACILPSLALVADLAGVQTYAAAVAGVTIDDDTPMWIRAWGGQGGANDGTEAGGAPGLAQTLTTLASYQSTYGTTDLYYYVGSLGDGSHEAGKGGSSTIVASADLATVDACLPPTSSDCTQNVLLIAGGGGGGGSDDEGGAGGQAIASLGEAGTEGGDSSDDAGGGDAGEGGSANGTGDGGSAGNDGIGGFGGPVHTSNGASSTTGWLNGTPTTLGTDGQGGEGKHDSDSGYLGGGGGGGWGGGGGGGAGGSEGHGGGGGGSYAIAATESGSVPSGSPGTTNGAVEVGFLLSGG